MMKDEARAYNALDYIREHPEEWNQEQYFACGTTACFAGRVLIQAGLANLNGYVFPLEMSYADKARTLLGWSETEARRVFYCLTHDFDVLSRAVKEVLNGEIDDDGRWWGSHTD